MEAKTVKSNRGKSQRDNVKVVTTNWHYTEEPSPAFKRLMMLLLKPVDNQSAETIQAVEEQQNE